MKRRLTPCSPRLTTRALKVRAGLRSLAMGMLTLWNTSVFAQTAPSPGATPTSVATSEPTRTSAGEPTRTSAGEPTVASPPAAKSLVATKDVRHSALLAPAGTLEFALFSYSRYTLNEHVELSLHPVGFFLWPEVDAKVRWWDCSCGKFTLSTNHALTYPTWFLNAVEREGTGGLIDPNAKNPVAVLMDLAVLGTWQIGNDSWATVEPRATVRLGERGPGLDFPFLYQRLAALDGGYTLALRAALEGVIRERVGYEFAATYTHLPVETVTGAFALEALLEARIKLTKDSTLPLGVRFAHAEFPIGRRNHWFPYLDFRMVW